MFELTVALFWHAASHAKITLLKLSVFDFFAQSSSRLRSLGKYHDSPRRSVKSVYKSDVRVSLFVVFVYEIFLNNAQHILIARAICLRRYVARLHDDYHVVVLINYR